MTTTVARNSLHTPGLLDTLLDVRSLTMRFGSIEAVSDVDLVVRDREMVALVGPHGCGKSTLFNCLTGLSAPTSGQLRFSGRPLPATPRHAAEAGIARTFQTVRLFDQMTVADNARMGGAGTEWLDFVGLRRCGFLPAAELNLFQQRSLEIARALAAGPRLLLLDCPFEGLSAVERDDMASLLVRIREEGIALVVASREWEPLLDVCDTAVALERGQVVASGTAEEMALLAS